MAEREIFKKFGEKT